MNWKRLVPILICFLGIFVFLAEPSVAQEGVRKGLRLCGTLLIPSLFPVSVLAGCLIRIWTDRGNLFFDRWAYTLFGIPGSGLLAVFLGLLGGYPLGAQIVSAMYRDGRLSKDEAAALSAVCNNAGPAFLIGTVGLCVFDDALPGLRLWLIQIASAALTGLALRPAGSSTSRNEPSCARFSGSILAVLPASISESALAMLRLTGSVVFFCTVQGYLDRILSSLRLPVLWQAGISCFLELAGGITRLSGLSPALRFPMASAFCGFGGICVHLQAWACFSGAGIPARRYLLAKALQGLFAGSLAVLLQGCATDPRCFPSAAITLLCFAFFVFFKKQIGIRQNL